jgi:hypothetical protein
MQPSSRAQASSGDRPHGPSATRTPNSALSSGPAQLQPPYSGVPLDQARHAKILDDRHRRNGCSYVSIRRPFPFNDCSVMMHGIASRKLPYANGKMEKLVIRKSVAASNIHQRVPKYVQMRVVIASLRYFTFKVPRRTISRSAALQKVATTIKKLTAQLRPGERLRKPPRGFCFRPDSNLGPQYRVVTCPPGPLFNFSLSPPD